MHAKGNPSRGDGRDSDSARDATGSNRKRCGLACRSQRCPGKSCIAWEMGSDRGSGTRCTMYDQWNDGHGYTIDNGELRRMSRNESLGYNGLVVAQWKKAITHAWADHDVCRKCGVTRLAIEDGKASQVCRGKRLSGAAPGTR